MEGIARLKSMTGEVVKICFDLIMQNPGHKSNIYSVANIEIYLDVPPNRPFPDYVLVKLHFLPPTTDNIPGGRRTSNHSGPEKLYKR